MARSYAQILLTIWNDPDFRACTTDGQWLYFVMLTHPSLTSCGVMDWREPRLVALAEGMDVQRLRNAAYDLGSRGLIAVDPNTEEGLVRSFVRHDGILKSPNKTKGLVREHALIASPLLLELVSRETRRAVEENPDLRGKTIAEPVWKQFTESEPPPIHRYIPEWFQTGLEGFRNGSERVSKGFRKGSERVPNGFDNGSEMVSDSLPPKQGNPSKSVPPPSTLIPQPSTVVEIPAAKASGQKQKRGSRIGEDWKPSQRVVDTIVSEFPFLDLRHEHNLFIDYWLAAPGQKGVKLDWDATWRGWMRRTGKRAHQERSRGGGAGSTDERVQGWLDVGVTEGNKKNS